MNLGKNFSKKYLVNLFGQLAISRVSNQNRVMLLFAVSVDFHTE